MLIAGVGLVILLLALWSRAGTKPPPMDGEVVRRIRRFAEQSRREELLPYE